MPNRGRQKDVRLLMASSYKQILGLGLLMDLVLSNWSGFEVRTQKPTSRAELVSDGSNSHELRTKGCTCPLPQPLPLIHRFLLRNPVFVFPGGPTILLARTSLIPFGLSKGLSRHEKKASVNGLMYVDVVVNG